MEEFLASIFHAPKLLFSFSKGRPPKAIGI